MERTIIEGMCLIFFFFNEPSIFNLERQLIVKMPGEVGLILDILGLRETTRVKDVGYSHMGR